MTMPFVPAKGLFVLDDENLSKAQAVIKSKGTYRQVPIVRRGTQLFVRTGSTYIALHKQGATSSSAWEWDTVDGVQFMFDTLGRMHIKEEVPLAKTTRKRVKKEK